LRPPPATAGSNYTLIDSMPTNLAFPEYWIQTTAASTVGNFTASADSWTDSMLAFF
jgi:hypothetical protein